MASSGPHPPPLFQRFTDNTVPSTAMQASLRAQAEQGNATARMLLAQLRKDNAKCKRKQLSDLKAQSEKGDPAATQKLQNQRDRRAETRKARKRQLLQQAQQQTQQQRPRTRATKAMAAQRIAAQTASRVSTGWLDSMPGHGSRMVSAVKANCQQRLLTTSTGWSEQPVHPVVQVRFKADSGSWVEQLTWKSSQERDGGRGVFAARRFEDGETLTRYCGVKNRSGSAEYTLRLEDETLLDASGSSHYLFAHYVNHSAKRANCVLRNGRVVAEGSIAAGEELLLDYGDESTQGKIESLQSEVARLNATLASLTAVSAT